MFLSFTPLFVWMNIMNKIVYLASGNAIVPGYNIDYNDLYIQRDISGDMLEVDLVNYDVIIATPPCNYWSRANYRRKYSFYSLMTFHLLPCILMKLYALNKPFIVENVRNSRMFKENGLFDFPGIYVYIVGRHTYWSNVKFDVSDIVQKPLIDIRMAKKGIYLLKIYHVIKDKVVKRLMKLLSDS